MRAVSLQRRLLLLAAVAILPLALMSGIALLGLLNQQRQQMEQSTLDLARALATAVDTELRLTISALQTLASTLPLDESGDADVEAWQRLSTAVLAGRPEWRVLQIAEPSGAVVFSSDATSASSPTQAAGSDDFDAVARDGLPGIGSLLTGPSALAGVPVRVALSDGGSPRYVLTAIVKPDTILEVVRRQRVPAAWIVSVFDAGNTRVARSRDHDKYLGTSATPSLVALQATGFDEGVGESETLEGQRVVTAFIRLRPSGWTVAIGVPTAIAEGALSRSAGAYGGGILLSLALGGLAAFLVGRSIARPIARLGDAAVAVGRGEPPSPVNAGLREVDAVEDALVGAAELRSRAAAEREALLVSEREARAVADGARRRLQLLVDAGDTVSRSLDEQTTLHAIAGVIVPALADWCRVDLLDVNGALRCVVIHHSDAERSRSIATLVKTLKPRPGAAGSMSRAIESGEMQLAHFPEPGDYREIADPDVLTFARAIGMRGYCVVPLVGRGRTLGALAAIQAESGRSFASEDCALIHELAHRAALALDNVRLFDEVSAALHQAEVANRVKDDFLAMLGHELRNPLAPIVTSLELMARRGADADTPERRVIERQVGHLARLVDDLLDVSRIARGKIQLNRQRLDFRDVIARALELAEPALAGRAEAPELLLPESPAWVVGDDFRLAQVVANLLTNAAKFSTPVESIRLALRCTASTVELVVSDEGIGIPATLLPQVFERFVQGEQALHRADGGLGLGLAIARNIVELHEGTIRAESAGPGHGSRFVVTLPSAPVEAEPAPQPETSAAATRRSARILVVDDNVDAAEALAEVLMMEGYDVRTAASAEEAIALLDGFSLEIGLFDIGLPKMDGYGLARVLRADPRHRAARLVALTGYGRDNDRARALEAGFDGHMVKPVDIESLLARLDALLAAAERADA